MKEEKFSRNIYWYNFIMSILVVLIHSRNVELFQIQQPFFYQTEMIIVEQIACIAVPGFYLCSGYLFYRNFTLGKLREKWKSRILSTVIPFLVWNFIYYMIHYLLYKIPVGGGMFSEETVPFSLTEVLNALFHYKYNPVFWYLQFLIIYIFMCPIIYVVIKNKWTGIVGIVLVYGLAVSHMLDQYSAAIASVVNWLFIYMAGGYAGIHGREIIEQGKKNKIMLIICGAGTVIFFLLKQNSPQLTWVLLYYLFAPVLLWFVLSNVNLCKAPEWIKNTFYIYAVHFMIVQFGNKIVYRITGANMYAGIIMFFALPAVVVIFCNYSGRLMNRYMPVIWGLVSGNRSRK